MKTRTRELIGTAARAAQWSIGGIACAALICIACSPARLAVRAVSYDVDVRLDPLAHTIDSQHEDGLFHPNGGGTQCHDLDAVSMLANLYRDATPSLQARARRSMTRALEALD